MESASYLLRAREQRKRLISLKICLNGMLQYTRHECETKKILFRRQELEGMSERAREKEKE